MSPKVFNAITEIYDIKKTWKKLPVNFQIMRMYTDIMRNKIQEYRWKKGWSEETLARKAGVSRSTICQLENGKINNPSIEVAFKIADALKVDVRELFY